MAIEDIGAVAISIEGDYSPLEAAFSAAETSAAAAGTSIAESLAAGAAASGATIATELGQSLHEVETAAASAGAGMGGFGSEAEGAGASASEAAHGITEAGAAAREAGEHAHEAHGQFLEMLEVLLEFAGIELGLEALKELGTEAITAAANVERAKISLEALTGSATAAEEIIAGIEELANNDALSFPTLLKAAQRMEAFLGPTADIPDILASVADGAAAAMKDIDAAANSFDRLATGGNASAKILMGLGLQMDDLAKAMETDTASVHDAFKALDVSERIDVIQTALGKFEGLSEKLAGTIPSQWIEIGNMFDHVMIQIGNAIGPLIKSLLQISEITIFPALELAAKGFTLLLSPINALIDALGIHKTKMGEAAGAHDELTKAVKETGDAEAESVSKTEATATAHVHATAEASKHADAILKAAHTMEAYGYQTVAEVDAIEKVKGAHDSATSAVQSAARVLAEYGIESVDAAKAIENHTGTVHGLGAAHQRLGGYIQDTDSLQQNLTNAFATGGVAGNDYAAALSLLGMSLRDTDPAASSAADSQSQMSGATIDAREAAYGAAAAADALSNSLGSVGQASAEVGSVDMPTASQSFDDTTKQLQTLNWEMNSAGKNAHSVGGSMVDMGDQAGGALQSLSSTWNSTIGNVIGDLFGKTSDIGHQFEQLGITIVKTVGQQIIGGALNPLLGVLGNVGESIGGIFSSIAGGVTGGVGAAVSTASSLIGSVTGFLGSALPTLLSAFGASHTDNVLGQIEHNTRYLEILFEQNVAAMRNDSIVADLDIIKDRVTGGAGPSGLTGGSSGVQAATINVYINIPGAQNPQAVAQAVANYLMSISPKFSTS